MQLHKIVKNHGHFSHGEAANKLLLLVLRNIEKDWKMPPITWKRAVDRFAIRFGERFTNAMNWFLVWTFHTQNFEHIQIIR